MFFFISLFCFNPPEVAFLYSLFFLKEWFFAIFTVFHFIFRLLLRFIFFFVFYSVQWSYEVKHMDRKELYELLSYSQEETKLYKQPYWPMLWQQYITEKCNDFSYLNIKEAIPRFVSECNLRERRHLTSCTAQGVEIRTGDICYIDFGEAYINEIGFQHFALILTLYHGKAFVVPMSGNYSAYLQAYDEGNPKGKRHLMRLGKLKGMNKHSVLFLNDAKWINTARIIDVKSHVSKKSKLFLDIKERVKECLD